MATVAYSTRCVSDVTSPLPILSHFWSLQSLLTLGVEGGREAASRLRHHIIGHYGGNTDILVHIFFNREGLGTTIKKYMGVSLATFSAFISGFNSASPLMSMLDVGVGKEAADSKIRGMTIFYESSIVSHYHPL
jgi:hypothetical protein